MKKLEAAAPLINQAEWEKMERVLFIVHLAIGDYTYLQNAFLALSKAYPHLKIDLFVEEVRRTSNPKKWPFLKNYALFDWLESAPFIHKIYRENYSPALHLASIEEAKKERYPVVISLGTLQSANYAALAREIAGERGRAIGMDLPLKWYQFRLRRSIKTLDGLITPIRKERESSRHVSEDYAYWFEQLAGLDLSSTSSRYPFITLPEEWRLWAKEQVETWRCGEKSPLVLINYIAKNPRRSWRLSQVADLIREMQSLPKWRDAIFLLNAIPETLPDVEALIEQESLKSSYAFSATENFFQLPAMLAECTLIISVETAVMHLANAVKVPSIALMRLKTPEWVPLNREITEIIFTPRREQVISDIPVSAVIEALPKVERWIE